jgi:hypothetical protein
MIIIPIKYHLNVFFNFVYTSCFIVVSMDISRRRGGKELASPL